MNPLRAAYSLAVGCFVLLSAAAAGAAAPEAHAGDILKDLTQTRQAALRALQQEGVTADKVVFVAFWDFDGTLLKGDCSEGLIEEGHQVYAGLAQVCIEKGLSPQYPAGPGAFARFWADYQMLDERVGHWLSYPYLVQIFHGNRTEDLRALSALQFRTVLAPYLFASSMHVLRGLEAQGVRNYVISASAQVFVAGAAECLGLPADRLHGIVLATDASGRLTRDLVPPVTQGEGKVQKLLRLVADLQAEQPGRQVCILAAFGNSYGTDGPFLEYTSRVRLPGGGRGLAVMINGGSEPARYSGRFRLVNQEAVVGTPAAP